MLKKIAEAVLVAGIGVLLVLLSGLMGSAVELISGWIGYVLIAGAIILLFTRKSAKEEWKIFKNWIYYKMFPSKVVENPCEVPCSHCTVEDRENCRTPKDVYK